MILSSGRRAARQKGIGRAVLAACAVAWCRYQGEDSSLRPDTSSPWEAWHAKWACPIARTKSGGARLNTHAGEAFLNAAC